MYNNIISINMNWCPYQIIFQVCKDTFFSVMMALFVCVNKVHNINKIRCVDIRVDKNKSGFNEQPRLII